MKLLMIYSEKFAYNTTSKTLPSVPEINESREIDKVL